MRKRMFRNLSVSKVEGCSEIVCSSTNPRQPKRWSVKVARHPPQLCTRKLPKKFALIFLPLMSFSLLPAMMRSILSSSSIGQELSLSLLNLDFYHMPTAHPLQVTFSPESNKLIALTDSDLPKRKLKAASKGFFIDNRGDDEDYAYGAEECKQYSREWHTRNYQVCNPLHEIDMEGGAKRDSFELKACGTARCSFHIKDRDDVSSLALKKGILRKKDAGPDKKSVQDGMTMERLSSSPYILNSYGYCGNTQVLEYASEGNLHDLIYRARKEKKDDMPPVDKLRIAIQLVTAVADLHTVEEDEIVSITHNDICCHQFVLVDGVYKLNDFHLSSFTKMNRTSHEICLEYSHMNSFYDYLRPPEGTLGLKFDKEKADDYTVGNVVYQILTKKYVMEDKEEELQWLREGGRSPIPAHILKSTDPADIAVIKAINMLWTHEVSERPSSREVSEYLIGELEKITGEKVEGTVLVSVPPLPEDWDFVESNNA